MTFVDEDGVRRSMQWFGHRNKEELRRKRKYHETVMREIGGTSFPRMPDINNYVLPTYVDDPQPWEDVGDRRRGPRARQEHRRVLRVRQEQRPQLRAAIRRSADGPLNGRTRRRSRRRLRVVETNDKGIVVDGVKAIGTGTAFADWIHIGVFFRPGHSGRPDHLCR